jgi:hypothetical protein
MLLVGLLTLSATFIAHAPARAQKDDCASVLSAIGAQQHNIDAARDILSPDEASCAFADFIMPVTGDCARLKDAADADAKKRKAWTSAKVAWSALDQLRLQLRGVEDRRGSTCTER